MSSAEDSRRSRKEDPSGTAAFPPSNLPVSSDDSAARTEVRGQPVVNEDRTVISKRPPLALGKLPVSSSPHLLGNSLVGQRLEYYELNEFVGGGGMGAVFRATDTRLGRTVAVKVLSRDHTDEETIRRFRNEAQNAARLDHPNIARVYYVGEDRGWNFIVFEFIEGINLRELVDRDGPLELERALLFTLHVAEALAHASGRDIVHRDIKPSNVLVTSGSQLKLVDMGLARLHQVESSSDDLTASGVTLGTFDYISPEQARDPRAADVRSDIYSLGCTLYFMLTGQPPFPEGTALQKLLRHNSDDPPDVRSFRPELHPRVSALLARMLAKKPSHREQSPDDLIAEIVLLGQQLGLRSLAEYHHVPTVLPGSASSWRGPVLQVAAAIAVFFAAVAAMELVIMPRNAGGDYILQPQFKQLEKTTLPDPAAPSTSQESPLISANSSPGEIENWSPAAARPAMAIAAAAPGGMPYSESDSLPPGGAAQAVVTESPLLNSRITDSAAAVEPRPKRLVVLADSRAPPEPQTEYFVSLAAAADRAAELGMNEIELGFDGPHVEPALEVSATRLVVRAAEGRQPVIVFQPEAGYGSRQMIRLAGGASAHVEMVGVELRLELPADPPSDSWAIFAMSTGQSLQLQQCVLTVVDGDEDQLPIHDQAAMILLQRRRAADAMSMGDPQLAMGQQARIALDRTIARGEASLVRMPDETPLAIRWNQGLLITPKHLIETGGSSTEPQYYEQIVLDLDHVTAVARQGLYHLRRGPSKAYQFHINSYADRCVFVADAGAPLFEMVGLPIPPETEELQSTGDRNRFSPADMPFLFVRQTAGSEPFVAKLGRKWSSEPRSQAGVPWLETPPFDRPAHSLEKHQFLIDADLSDEPAGFDPLLMPDIWRPKDSANTSETDVSRALDLRALIER